MKSFIILILAITPLLAEGGTSMNEVRTYMPFTFPVDPAKIQTIPDMDMSYALASTLVEWDSEKQISAGLAESWKIVGPNTYRFTLRQNAKWSNGNPITSTEVKKSLERGSKVYPDDMRSFIQLVTEIETPSEREIDFKLTVPAKDSGFLGKLTEPNFGVLKVSSNGKVDLSVSTGAFFLDPSSNQKELTLVRNIEWHRFDASVRAADRVIVRRTPKDTDSQNVLLNDSWPNLIETSSLIGAEYLKKYDLEKFEIWKRPLDKIFHMRLSKRNAKSEGKALIRFLQKKVKPSEFVINLSGFSLTDQLFPRGYQLYDPEFSNKNSEELSLPEEFQGRPLEILISHARVSKALKENIRKAITRATGVEPKFISISLDELTKYEMAGNFDLYAGTVGLADPDPEGVMSFYLEGNTPIISSKGNNYLERLDSARKEKNPEQKLKKMRGILRDAVCEGYLLPMFHLSTVGIGRPELDFSSIPASEESVTFSKIRFRAKK